MLILILLYISPRKRCKLDKQFYTKSGKHQFNSYSKTKNSSHLVEDELAPPPFHVFYDSSINIPAPSQTPKTIPKWAFFMAYSPLHLEEISSKRMLYCWWHIVYVASSSNLTEIFPSKCRNLENTKLSSSGTSAWVSLTMVTQAQARQEQALPANQQ